MDIITNSTIVVNHPTDGSFGCKKRCSYCTWVNSPNLPNGTYDFELMDDFIKGSTKNFITISGGGDPLFKINSNKPYKANLIKIINLIRNNGKKVRIITREVSNIQEIENGLVDEYSISLDSDTFRKLMKYKPSKFKISLVLPKTTAEEINEKFIPWVKNVQSKLNGCDVILREDLNSLFVINWDYIAKDNGIFYVKRELCLQKSNYFINDKVKLGVDVVEIDRREVLHKILNYGGLLFGGALKHLVAPSVNESYGDLDIAITPNLMVKISFYLKILLN